MRHRELMHIIKKDRIIICRIGRCRGKNTFRIPSGTVAFLDSGVFGTFVTDRFAAGFYYLLARFDEERLAVASTINGGDTPRDADPQEDVHRVTSSHIAHTRVGILVLASGHLARERV